MKKLIITADDYGMSLAVNQAIEKGIECGVITTTNVMINLDFAYQAKELRVKYPETSIGLHWNITVGKPVLSSEKVKSLVDEKGNFHTNNQFLKNLKAGKINIYELESELTAQYEKYISVLGEPDYWNTHQNVSVHLAVFDVFTKLADKLQIKKMRFHKKIYVNASDGKNSSSIKKIFLELMKTIVLIGWRKKIEKLNISSPSGVLVFRKKEDYYKINDFIKNIVWGKNETAELVLHPAISIDSEYFGKMTQNRLDEYKIYCNKEAYRIINKQVKLINFDNI